MEDIREKSIGHQFSRKINFPGWFETAMSSLKKECIAAFDPSYINKSGKKTYGKDWFWSGKDQQTKPGLEIRCLALVDVADDAAYSIEAVQTPSRYERKVNGALCKYCKEEYRFHIILYPLPGSRRLLYEEQLYRPPSGIKAACNNPDAARCQSVLPLQGSAKNRQRKKKALCRKSGCKKDRQVQMEKLL